MPAVVPAVVSAVVPAVVPAVVSAVVPAVVPVVVPAVVVVTFEPSVDELVTCRLFSLVLVVLTSSVVGKSTPVSSLPSIYQHTAYKGGDKSQSSNVLSRNYRLYSYRGFAKEPKQAKLLQG